MELTVVVSWYMLLLRISWGIYCGVVTSYRKKKIYIWEDYSSLKKKRTWGEPYETKIPGIVLFETNVHNTK